MPEEQDQPEYIAYDSFDQAMLGDPDLDPEDEAILEYEFYVHWMFAFSVLPLVDLLSHNKNLTFTLTAFPIDADGNYPFQLSIEGPMMELNFIDIQVRALMEQVENSPLPVDTEQLFLDYGAPGSESSDPV